MKLAQIAFIENGKTPSKEEQRDSGFPVLKIKDISDNGEFVGRFDSFVEIHLARKFPQKMIVTGDTLILNAAHNADYVASKICLAPYEVEGVLATGEWMIVRANSEHADTKYIYYWLKHTFNSGRITDLVKGIHLYPKDVAELSVDLPPLNEQRRIATILRAADDERRRRRYTQSLSDSLLSEIFVEMFGDPATNPMGWDIVNLVELCEVHGGLQISQARNAHTLTKPYLRVANVFRGFLDLSEIKYIGLTRAEAERTKLKKGDLLLVEGHGNIDEIGRCAVWDGSIPDCVHQNHLICARPNQQLVNSLYLSQYVNSSAGRNYFRLISNTTSGLNTISTNTVKGCPVLLPPIDIQHRFATIAADHEKIYRQQVESTRQTEYLFQTLLHRAFRGEL